MYFPNIICLSDKWLFCEITDSIKHPEGYHIGRNDRINSGRGSVLFCYKQHLTV